MVGTKVRNLVFCAYYKAGNKQKQDERKKQRGTIRGKKVKGRGET
jgi:hypothetical protein